MTDDVLDEWDIYYVRCMESPRQTPLVFADFGGEFDDDVL